MGMRLMAIALAGAALAGCAWVSVTPGGAAVQVVGPAEVSGCTRKGKVTVSVKDKIGVLARSENKVAGELETLARNEAARMDGNRVVAESEIADGQRVYGIFACSEG